MADRYPLDGRVALVTGAARGIGFETARLLHARGASVALLDLRGDEVEAAADRIGSDRLLAIGADVTDGPAVARAVGSTVKAFGGLDVPVANAGIAPPMRPMSVVDAREFQRVLEVNVTGVWNTVRHSLEQVIERRGHAVVVASVYAFMNGVLATPYAMSKAAVEQLGRSLRVELAAHGASAGVAYFGFVDTDMVRNAFEDRIAARLEGALLNGPLQRRITPARAAEGLVAGIERRAPRTIVPRPWRALWALQGLLNPLLDRRIEAEPELRSVIREAEAAGRGAFGS